MKPSITPELLYNNADFTEVKHMEMIEGIYRLIWMLDCAKRVENEKPMLERRDDLIHAQAKGIEHWRGIIAMVTKPMQEDWLSWKDRVKEIEDEIEEEK